MASNSALAAARAEVGKLQAALSTAQRELSTRTREANESSQQLDTRVRELNERSQEIAQLHAVIAELRQQVEAYEQQRAAAAPRYNPLQSSLSHLCHHHGQSLHPMA